jgi:hypothetical protein
LVLVPALLPAFFGRGGGGRVDGAHNIKHNIITFASRKKETN